MSECERGSEWMQEEIDIISLHAYEGSRTLKVIHCSSALTALLSALTALSGPVGGEQRCLPAVDASPLTSFLDHPPAPEPVVNTDTKADGQERYVCGGGRQFYRRAGARRIRQLETSCTLYYLELSLLNTEGH